MITTLTGCLYLGTNFCDVGAVVDEDVEIGYYSFTWLEDFHRGGCRIGGGVSPCERGLV